MKQFFKKLGSVFLTLCLVLTMLPTVAFATEDDQDSGMSLTTSEIIAFANLAEDVSLQEVVFGTSVDELNLLNTLTTTVTTGTAITNKFKDTNFLAAVYTAIGKTDPNPIYDTDVSGIEFLDVSNKKIKSLAGIEYFTGLIELRCYENQLNTLDVSKNTALTKLYCHSNDLSKLDVSENTELTSLNCGDNNLTELDVDKNTKLTYLGGYNNQLKKLEVSSNIALAKLQCENNQLTEQNVSKNTKLIELKCYNNRLTELDVSNNTALIELECKNNPLTTLDVSNNIKLTRLWCQGNQLTDLDVSNNIALTWLNCENNQLTTLDVSNNTALISLYCTSNQLTGLDVTNNTALITLWCSKNLMPDKSAITGLKARVRSFHFDPQYLSGTDITADFTDKNFLARVRSVLNKGAGAPIYIVDIENIKTLDVSNKKIESLEGIEHFTKLTELKCNYNQLTKLNVSKNTKLTTLRCYNNRLRELDVSKNTLLQILQCSYNQLTTLDMTNNIYLQNLVCYGNYMPDKSAVTWHDDKRPGYYVFDKQKTRTDITAAFTDDKFLAAVYTAIDKTEPNPIYDADVSWITFLDVSIKNIQSLAGIEYFTELTELHCSDNPLTEFDVSNNTALTKLWCYNNPLTELNVSKNTKLTELICHNNGLTELNVSNNIALTFLNCENNQLTTLDVSNNTALTHLFCISNQLTGLDMRKNTALTKLWCSKNLMLDKSAVTWLNEKRPGSYIFDPQNPSTSTYNIKVNSGIADKRSASSDETVSITANTAPSGKQFKKWTVLSGSITLANEQAGSTTFTMPTSAVEITATYEEIPAVVTPISGVTLNKNNLSLYSNTSPNTEVLIASVVPASATDKSVTWQSSNTTVATVDTSGNVKAVGSGTATITVTTIDGGYTAYCTVKVSTKINGGGSSSNRGGGSFSSGSASTPTVKPSIPTAENPKPATEVTTTVKPTVSNGTANVTVSSSTVTNAIHKAQAEAKKKSTTENGIIVEIKVDTKNTTAKNISTNLLKSSVDALVKAEAKEVRIVSEVADIHLNLDTLKEIQEQVGADLNVSAKKVDNNTLSAEAKKIVGNRPVYDFSITDANGKKVTDFGNGNVTVSIPYTLRENENPENLVAYYIDSTGKVQEMPNSVYNTESKTLSFITNHFSKFAVGYKVAAVTFSDITNHWAKESVEFVAARGLFSGTGSGKFSPNISITRGMFVTALGRLAEVEVNKYAKSSFTDVKNDAYYMPYIEWAVKNNIVNGIGNGKFAPEQSITREQMAVIMNNNSKAIDFALPKVHAENTFGDNAKIANYAKDAVKAMQMAGILTGKNGNQFDPQGTATRAETSTVLRLFVELMIDSDTTQD